MRASFDLERATQSELRTIEGALRRELWALDPVRWANERLGEQLWSKQREVAESVATRRHTAVRACHASGKSFVAARLACWWIDTHPEGEAIVVISAPTMAQIKSVLWKEMRTAHEAGGLAGEMRTEEWIIEDKQVAIARRPQDYDPAAFQGIHARYVLVILDEASGIPEPLWVAADTLVANEDSRLLVIGNPDDPASQFGKVCRPGSGWNVIGISAHDTPAYSGEEVTEELLSLLISKTWVKERAERWGEESPLYVAKVMGRFPDVSDHSVIPLGWIERARERFADARTDGVAHLGVDVARQGSDETVICAVKGDRVWVHEAYRGADLMETAGRVILARRELGAASIMVDEIGIGAGVLDRLAEQGEPVIGVNFGSRSSNPERYLNLRAECYWFVRELFDPIRGPGIAIDPTDEALAEQLASIRYAIDSRGKTKIESKDEMRSRGIHSPDRADALVLAVTVPPAEEQTWILEEDDDEYRVHISDY